MPGHAEGDLPEAPIERLVAIMAILRSPEGCPWDREQSLQTLKPYCIEEAYEVLQAIDDGDPDKHCEELGDLLLQVVFQAQLRREENAFTFDDVATAINDKLLRRHPHVFGDVQADTSAEVLQNWDAIKKEERGEPGHASMLNGVPAALPALLKAQEIQKRAARAGFDWEAPEPVLDKLDEEIGELREAVNAGDAEAVREEIGDLLFSVVNLCRHRKVNAEEVLSDTIRKFVHRFEQVEAKAAEAGMDMRDAGLQQLDAWWDEAKQAGK